MPGGPGDPVRLSPARNIIEVGWAGVIAVQITWRWSAPVSALVPSKPFDGCADEELAPSASQWVSTVSLAIESDPAAAWKWKDNLWETMVLENPGLDGPPYVSNISGIPTTSFTPDTDTMGSVDPTGPPEDLQYKSPFLFVQSPLGGLSPKPAIPFVTGGDWYGSTTTAIGMTGRLTVIPPSFRKIGSLCVWQGYGTEPVSDYTWPEFMTMDLRTIRVSVTTPATTEKPAEGQTPVVPARPATSLKYKPIGMRASPLAANNPPTAPFPVKFYTAWLLCEKTSS